MKLVPITLDRTVVGWQRCFYILNCLCLRKGEKEIVWRVGFE